MANNKNKTKFTGGALGICLGTIIGYGLLMRFPGRNAQALIALIVGFFLLGLYGYASIMGTKDQLVADTTKIQKRVVMFAILMIIFSVYIYFSPTLGL